MTRAGLALAIASCFSGAALGATPPPPPNFNVKVTNPVLAVEIRNADPLPVVSATPETTLGNFGAQINQLIVAGSDQNDYPILSDVP